MHINFVIFFHSILFHISQVSNCLTYTCFYLLRRNVEYWVTLGEHDRMLNRSNEMQRVIKGPIPSSLRHADKLATSTNTHAPIEQTILVAEVLRHPDYNFFKYYDIALLRLSKPVNCMILV